MTLYERIVSHGGTICTGCRTKRTVFRDWFYVPALGWFCGRNCAENTLAKRLVGCRRCGFEHDGACPPAIISMNLAAIPSKNLERIVKAARR